MIFLLMTALRSDYSYRADLCCVQQKKEEVLLLKALYPHQSYCFDHKKQRAPLGRPFCRSSPDYGVGSYS